MVKEFFRPTRVKVIIWLVLSFVFYILAFFYFWSMKCICAFGGFDNCVDYSKYQIVQSGCHCSCTELSTVVSTNLTFLGIFVVIYLIICVVEWRRKNEK